MMSHSSRYSLRRKRCKQLWTLARTKSDAKVVNDKLTAIAIGARFSDVSVSIAGIKSVLSPLSN